jgi:hypothetical protein
MPGELNTTAAVAVVARVFSARRYVDTEPIDPLLAMEQVSTVAAVDAAMVPVYVGNPCATQSNPNSPVATMPTYFGGSVREPPQYRYANGSMVAIGGLDNPTKVMSSEYDICYIQESTELNVKDCRIKLID